MTYGEMAEDQHARGKGRRRNKIMITDNCDFCLKIVHIYRNQIALRRYGRKFMCEFCRFKDGRQDEAVENRYLPCWQHTINMKGTKKRRF